MPSASLANTEDTPCTVGVQTAPEYLLITDSFPGGALARRSEVSFDVHSGVATLERGEVMRDSQAGTGDSGNRRAPKVALVKHKEGKYQIPTTIVTPRVTVTCK